MTRPTSALGGNFAGLCSYALGIATLAIASGCGDRPPASAGDRVATYRDGEVSLREVEQVLSREGATGSTGLETLLAAYREATESVVIDRLLLREMETAQILAALGAEGTAIERQVIANAYLAPRLGELRVTAEEIEVFYAEHRDAFRRDAQRNVWHLFRRHADPARPEQALELLGDLKRRVEAGEGFAQLAREYSDSETRVLGGRLGLIGAGRLPKKLEDKVFALPAGAVSEPLSVPGGVALFYVGDVIEARDFPLADVRTLIAKHLVEGKRRARIAELLAGREPPPGSTVLAPDRLVEVLTGGDAEAVVLAIGGDRLTAGELRRRLEPTPTAEQPMLEPSPRERLLQTYQDALNEGLLYLAAAELEPTPPQQRAIDERLRQLSREAQVRQQLEERMRQRAAADEPLLQRFYSDNRHLYQTAPRFKLQSLSVAAGPDAPQVLEVLDRALTELTLGTLDLTKAAARVGGTVVDLGWVDFETLLSYEPKVRYYVLDLNGTGYTVPFQVNQRLCLIWVEGREEPRQLSFVEVRERVVADYFDRHHQQLYRATLDELLAEAEFRYDEAAVRRALAPPALAPPASASAPGG